MCLKSKACGEQKAILTLLVRLSQDCCNEEVSLVSTPSSLELTVGYSQRAEWESQQVENRQWDITRGESFLGRLARVIGYEG